MIIPLLFFLAMDVEIQIQDQFQPLTLNQVALAEDGTIFFLHRDVKKIFRYGRDGSLLGTFSGPGPGPSELESPNNLMVHGPNCFVSDWNKGVLQFDLTGQFVETFKPSHPFVSPAKVADGWVYTVTNNQEKTVELVLCDERLQNPQTLVTYPLPSKEMFFRMSPEKKLQVKYLPGVERPLWVVSKDMKKVYLFVPESDHVQVIDLAARKVSAKMAVPFERERFNQGWGEFMAGEMKNRITVNGENVAPEIFPTYPSTFPLISDMMLGPDGQLWLYDGPSLMDRHTAAVVLDEAGNRLSTQESELPKRVLRMDADDYLVLCFDQESEAPYIRFSSAAALPDLLAAVPNSPKDGAPSINIRTQ